MTIWRWAALAGLATIAISVAFGMIPGIHACGLPGEPILNFEFVKSPSDVAALFPDHCRAEHVVAQRHGLWLDSMGFIPVYSAFLILSLVALRRESGNASRLAGAGIVLTLIAALSDQIEGIQLFTLLDTMPGHHSTIDILVPAVRIKFALLAIAIGIAAALHFLQPGWRKVPAAVMALGALMSLAGLIGDRALLMQGGTISWLTLFLTNALLAVRGRA